MVVIPLMQALSEQSSYRQHGEQLLCPDKLILHWHRIARATPAPIDNNAVAIDGRAKCMRKPTNPTNK